MKLIFIYSFICDYVEENEPESAGDEDRSRGHRFFVGIEDLREERAEQDTGADEEGEQTVFQRGERVRTERRTGIEIFQVLFDEPFVEDRHPFPVAGIDILPEHDGGAAKEEDGDDDIGIHRTSCCGICGVCALSFFDRDVNAKVS